MADPQDPKPREPSRQPDGVARPRSAEEEHSTRVRVGRYVTETPVQRLTVHSATPVPPSGDFLPSDGDHTVVDEPEHRRVFDGEHTSPETGRSDTEGPTSHRLPILPPLEEALLPGALDEDLLDREEWIPAGVTHRSSAKRPSTFSTEPDTTQHSIPGLLDYDNQETSRHRLDMEPPLLPPAPVRRIDDGADGPTAMRKVARPLLPALPPEHEHEPVHENDFEPEPEPAPVPAPRTLALPPPPPAVRAPRVDMVDAAVDSGPTAIPAEVRELQTDATNQPGVTLRGPLVGGRYRVVERIGAGGMGKVFKVVHATLGKTFALKIIRDRLAGQNKARDLFYREARMASSLSHPNIASVVDFGEDEKLGAFMVMEFLQGEPLAKLLKREKRLGLRQAIDIIQQVAEALHYIHSKGIIHCDIKTENILLTEVPDSKRRRVQVKLLDFGLARSTMTSRNTNSLAGTPHYVAPERIRGHKASPQSDIYGLGILFYELLTGRVPWDGNVDEILSGHLNLAPVPPSRLVDNLDPAVEKLILHALAKTPEQRHKNIAAFLYELRTVMDMLGYGRRRSGPRRVVRPANQRDETARALFDACRVPMALIDRGGIILVANAAFAQFVMGITVDIEGKAVASTPLARVWATFSADLGRACGGTSLRRTVQIQMDTGEIRRLLLWLDPGLNGDQAIFGVHSLDG